MRSGELADAITGAGERGKRGKNTRLGSPPYLHTVGVNPQLAPSAGSDADIVRVTAIQRAYTTAADRDEVPQFHREFKLAAVALFQCDRGPAHSTGNKPVLSDPRESECLGQDSDLLVPPPRPDRYDGRLGRVGETGLDVAKHCNGLTKTVCSRGRHRQFAERAGASR